MPATGNGGTTVIVVLVVGTLAGILLGIRFKVFVLAPATLLAAAVIIVSGNQPKVAMAFTVLATTVLLQIGFLVGLAIRAMARARPQRRTTAGSALPPGDSPFTTVPNCQTNVWC